MRTPFRAPTPSTTQSTAIPIHDASPFGQHVHMPPLSNPQSQPQNVPQQQIPLSTTAPSTSIFNPPNSTPTFSGPPNVRLPTESQPMSSNPLTVPHSPQIAFPSSSSFARSPPMAVPPPPSSMSQTPMSQSCIPPHLFASMHREPENMARSYIKRRPPPWL